MSVEKYLKIMRESKTKEKVNISNGFITELTTITTKKENDFIFDWCKDVCILTREMSKLCEKQKPCPKYGST